MTDTRTNPTATSLKRHPGGCQCGAVRFEVELDLSAPVNRCNCSVCTRRGISAAYVKPDALRILSSPDTLSEFRSGNSGSYSAFCKRCGCECFGAGFLEALGGDFRSINVNCIDGIDPATLTYLYWDGRHDNWAVGPRDTPWPVHP
ncbi:GFA family protein [Pyxidicoccus fallax]|uniref:GFA family protein n=1 Tax=Pyxidicoccus fallax TaxID=394095 RepID=A0A848LFI6_9BACT|nr:GFA family protein [Pyxidicoccus fallax]NMO15091.1 GFA family protein [Pyxidicoccus fallax]NPC79795.1 GFA family protein [Pyxidicoccus fallax]